MPLVTRDSSQGNLFKTSSTPNWTTSDLWVDTTNGITYVNVGGSAIPVSELP